MNKLEKPFVREGGAVNLSIFFDLVLRCFTRTGDSIDLYFSLLRRYWPTNYSLLCAEILVSGNPADPKALWKGFENQLAEDFIWHTRRNNLSEEIVRVFLIEDPIGRHIYVSTVVGATSLSTRQTLSGT